MPFKQPLRGISRMSDRVGGGGGLYPKVVHHTSGTDVNATANLGGDVQAGDLILLFALSSSTSVPAVPTGYTDLGTAGVEAGIVRACYKIADGTETSTVSSANTYRAAVVLIRDHGGVGQVATHVQASNSLTPTVPTISNVLEGSRIFIGTNSNFEEGVRGTAAALNKKIAFSLDIDAGESFGGTSHFRTMLVPSRQNFFAVEVLAA